jgi:hypothetical protein
MEFEMLLTHHLISFFFKCPLLLGDGSAHDVTCVITPCSIKFVLTFRRNVVEMDAKLSVILRMKAPSSSEMPENTWHNNLD